MENFINFISSLFKPIKSVFGLYLLMYLIPLSLPLYIAVELQDALVSKEGDVIFAVAGILGLCYLAALGWTIFFLIYFTRQRTSNPELYEKGFLSELTISEGELNDVE